MKLFPFWLAATPYIAGILSRWRKRHGPDLDQEVLDQLRQAGSNLAKPHTVEFFLYFPTEQAAIDAAKEIQPEVDGLKVNLGADETNWLCFGVKSMVPRPDDLRRLRKCFNQIANKHNGDYDGWGTEVVK
jgi:regulator of RNase E activity RraB